MDDEAQGKALVVDRRRGIAKGRRKACQGRHCVTFGGRVDVRIGIALADGHIMPGVGLFLPEIGGVGFHVVGPGCRLCQLLLAQEKLDIGSGQAA